MRVAIFVMLVTLKVYSYPQLFSHGYTSCTTCHNSAGGTPLSEYGLSVRNEFWGTSPPEYFGAMLKAAQLFEPAKGRFFPMQADVSARYDHGVASLYIQHDVLFNTPRKWQASLRGEGFILQVGKFKHKFGINYDDHNRTTEEIYEEQKGVQVIGIKGPFEFTLGNRSASLALLWQGQIGVSYDYSSKEVAVYTILSPTNGSYLSGEYVTNGEYTIESGLFLGKRILLFVGSDSEVDYFGGVRLWPGANFDFSLTAQPNKMYIVGQITI